MTMRMFFRTLSSIDNDFRRWKALTLACGLCLAALPACSTTQRWFEGGWHLHFDEAEMHAAKQQKDLLIHYGDNRSNTPLHYQEQLKSPAVKPHLKQFVRCRLIASAEPDRRYVQQFGVDRPPALIIVHPDNTYRAVQGAVTTKEVQRFLEDEDRPGAAAVVNPHLPRSARYSWHSSLPKARSLAREQDQPLLLLMGYLGFPENLQLNTWLEDYAVARQTQGWVHCRVQSVYPLKPAPMKEFGADELPALAVEYPNGSYRVLEKPESADQIARFLAGIGVETVHRGGEPPPESLDANQTTAAMVSPALDD